jgi:hypothetical protein
MKMMTESGHDSAKTLKVSLRCVGNLTTPSVRCRYRFPPHRTVRLTGEEAASNRQPEQIGVIESTSTCALAMVTGPDVQASSEPTAPLIGHRIYREARDRQSARFSIAATRPTLQ